MTSIPQNRNLSKLNKNLLSTPAIWYLIISLFSLTGTLIILYSTVWGAALSDDSYFYISSGRNLLSGNGFDLSSKVPPVLPLLLSLIGLFKVDPLSSIRWLNAILFGFNIFMVARILRTLTNSPVFSLLGALMTLIASTLIVVHSWAMSEALYICYTLAGLWTYTVLSDKQDWRAPFFTGLFFGMAAATRYIGFSLLLAGGIFWLIESGKNNEERIIMSFLFGLLGILPLLLWIIRNLIITGSPTYQGISWHPMPITAGTTALNTILLWFIPGRFVHGKELIWLGAIGLILIFWLGVTMLRNRNKHVQQIQTVHPNKAVLLLSLSVLAYGFVLIASRSLVDDHIPMDERLLSPLLVLGLILLVWLLSNSWSHHNWLESSFILAICLIFLLTNLTRSAQTVQSYHVDGRGYASARDHVSETYAYLRNRSNIPLYSNAWVAIYFWTGRVTNPIPSVDGIANMKASMKETGAYLVIFDSIPVELYGDTEIELTEGLVEQIRLSEATIYRSP
jgi:hypothetical protein